ncbi:MAG: polyphosphate kinase 2 family protein [Acidobacteriota bacterium]
MPPDALASLARRYEVTNGRSFKLKHYEPGDTAGLDLKDGAGDLLEQGVRRTADLQERLYAQDRWAVLLILQAMDAAGKDSTIKHVMSGVNPQGCDVHAFKAPSAEELDHDFLWRASRALPRRGHIGIFNRSYYEEVLVVRVHPELLARQQLPDRVVTTRIWKERFDDIRAFEAYLGRQGVVVRKIFLHVSPDEQRRRFLSRLREPEKHWKFALADVHERRHFADYMDAYQDAIAHTATRQAPWYVVPADRKWFTRLVVSSILVRTLEELKPAFPEIDGRKRRELRVAEAALMAEERA